MQASQFMARYRVGHSVTPIPQPDNERVLPGHPWFRVRFTLPRQDINPDGDRTVHIDYGGAFDDDVNTITAQVSEVFYRLAEAARYGESYEMMLEDFGADLHITREQWEQGQHATRRQCRTWLADDDVWAQFLDIEIDDPTTISAGVDVPAAATGRPYLEFRDTENLLLGLTGPYRDQTAATAAMNALLSAERLAVGGDMLDLDSVTPDAQCIYAPYGRIRVVTLRPEEIQHLRPGQPTSVPSEGSDRA